MPVVDRRSVRRAVCRADRPTDTVIVSPSDVLKIVDAIEISTTLIADAIENGFSEIAAAVWKEEV